MNEELEKRIATANWAFGALPQGALASGPYLDIGFGSGNALIAAALKGATQVSGIDIDFQQKSQDRPAFADFWQFADESGVPRERFNLIDGDILSHDFGRQTFAVVSLLDVIEHVSDPVACIRRCASLLKPGGLLLIAGGGLYHSPLGHHLWHWWPEKMMPWRHLWYDFTEESAEAIRQKSGVDDWYWDEFKRLNRVTIRTVRQACANAGLNEGTYQPLMQGGPQIHEFAHMIDIRRVPEVEDLFTAGLVLIGRKS